MTGVQQVHVVLHVSCWMMRQNFGIELVLKESQIMSEEILSNRIDIILCFM